MSTQSDTEQRFLPIGVFDSGVGGLTVVRAIREELPTEHVVYIGDTARVPYGGKSPATVERYGMEIGGLLVEDGVKAIVVACNTASALAVPRMQNSLPVPVLGVVEPGAKAAVSATRNGKIGVIATRATVSSEAYVTAMQTIRADVEVLQAACPLLVPLIEERWLENPVTDSVIAHYLDPVLSAGVDTLVLGCTHYPLLANAIAKYCGEAVVIVDSASATAEALGRLLTEQGILAGDTGRGSLKVSMTDEADGFLNVANEALGLGIENVDLRRVEG